MTSVSYAQLQSALANNANAIGDTAAGRELVGDQPGERPILDPDGGSQSSGT